MSTLRVHTCGTCDWSAAIASGWAWITAAGDWGHGPAVPSVDPGVDPMTAADEQAIDHAVRALDRLGQQLDLRTGSPTALPRIRAAVQRRGHRIALAPEGPGRTEVLRLWVEALSARACAQAALYHHRRPTPERGRFPQALLRLLPEFNAESGQLSAWAPNGIDLREQFGDRLLDAAVHRGLIETHGEPSLRARSGPSPFYQHGRWDLVALHEHCLPDTLRPRPPRRTA